MGFIISTENIWKTYRSDIRVIHAINDVSIKIPRGKKTCITGPSGSGKSTLLHLIGLLTYATQGEIKIRLKGKVKGGVFIFSKKLSSIMHPPV